jgi:hypothetical protein
MIIDIEIFAFLSPPQTEALDCNHKMSETTVARVLIFSGLPQLEST